MKKITLTISSILIMMTSYGQTQCKGVTKSNNKCKNITLNENSLCHNHDKNHVSKTKNNNETVICSGITKSSNKCKNKTKDKSGKCHHHRKND